MGIININEEIRKLVAKKFQAKDYLTNNDFCDDIDNFYDELLKNKEKFELATNVMYISSYIVNYSTYVNYLDDEKLKNNIELLDSLNLEFIDKEEFRFLIYDTLLYDRLDYYSKRKYFINSISKKDYLLKKVPIFLNDIIYFNKKFTSDYIINYYKEELKRNREKKDAIDKTVFYAIEFLKGIKREDYNNYMEIISNIINIYYEYDIYLLDNNFYIENINIDIIKAIENDPKYLKDICITDDNIIVPILKDFIYYSTLDKDEKKKIREYKLYKENNDYIYNVNDKIRKQLKDLFGYIDDFDEMVVSEYKEEINKLKNSKYIDEIIKILYIDNFSSICFEYLSLPTDEDVKLDYDYMKNIKSLDEYKKDLFENDFVLLNSINYSIVFNTATFIENKELVMTLTNSNMYDNFVTKDYIYDVISYNRDYNLNDVDQIYNECYIEFGDKQIADANSVFCLESELLTLSALDGRNYNNLIYEILKKYYMYNKYLLENNFEINDETMHILLLIENNIDKFFDDYEINIELQSKIFMSYYEYVSNCIVDKEKISLYYKGKDRGISKIFNKKNKNS